MESEGEKERQREEKRVRFFFRLCMIFEFRVIIVKVCVKWRIFRP
jgi:hypothetical protein